eukprot:CAMPEP_0118967666 /NCGR_PEP_ID=MMETSP1173-20130426/5024_1 /TAXON_ID=1034831 /ORGANISM="Rhizochromulina marina cf, Strain CCMP1243" /LENGTH=316 /DNA_ID=CAMNT_0006916673 /DNA_START=329 /DNA_END=1274 /DNA_ORIENTATION=+
MFTKATKRPINAPRGPAAYQVVGSGVGKNEGTPDGEGVVGTGVGSGDRQVEHQQAVRAIPDLVVADGILDVPIFKVRAQLAAGLILWKKIGGGSIRGTASMLVVGEDVLATGELSLEVVDVVVQAPVVRAIQTPIQRGRVSAEWQACRAPVQGVDRSFRRISCRQHCWREGQTRCWARFRCGSRARCIRTHASVVVQVIEEVAHSVQFCHHAFAHHAYWRLIGCDLAVPAAHLFFFAEDEGRATAPLLACIDDACAASGLVSQGVGSASKATLLQRHISDTRCGAQEELPVKGSQRHHQEDHALPSPSPACSSPSP